MAQVIKTNRLIPVIAGVFIVMAMLVFYTVKQEEKQVATVVSSGSFMSRAPQPKTADADTPSDTIRSLRGQMDLINANVESVKQHNESIKAERDDIKKDADALEARYQTLLTQTLEKQQQAHESTMDEVLAKLETIAVKNLQQATIVATPVVLEEEADSGEALAGIPDGFGLGVDSGAFVSGEDMIDVFWIEPLDESITRRQGSGVSNTPAIPPTVTQERSRSQILQPLKPFQSLVDRSVSLVGATQ